MRGARFAVRITFLLNGAGHGTRALQQSSARSAAGALEHQSPESPPPQGEGQAHEAGAQQGPTEVGLVAGLLPGR